MSEPRTFWVAWTADGRAYGFCATSDMTEAEFVEWTGGTPARITTEFGGLSLTQLSRISFTADQTGGPDALHRARHPGHHRPAHVHPGATVKVIRDWDGESYCTTDGCRAPAVTEEPTGMIGEDIIVELVCVEHAG